MIPQPARCEPTGQEFTLSPETVSCAPNCQAIGYPATSVGYPLPAVGEGREGSCLARITKPWPALGGEQLAVPSRD